MDEYWEPTASQPEFNYGGSDSSSALGALGFDVGVDNPIQAIFDRAEQNNLWSAAQAQKQMDFQRLMMEKSMNFNSSEALKNREWQEYMSNTAHQREIKDLQAAGLNPVLSVSGGNGAPVTSGATAASVGVPSGAKGDTDESSTSALTSWLANMLSAQTAILNTSVSAQAGMANAATMAGATTYAAQLANEASHYSSDVQATATDKVAGSVLLGVLNGLGGIDGINSALGNFGQLANDAGEYLGELISSKGKNIWNKLFGHR